MARSEDRVHDAGQPGKNPERMKLSNLTPAALLCALALASPTAAAAQGVDPAPTPASADAQAPEPQDPAVEAPAAEPQDAQAQEPAEAKATPAQDDTSGLNEYSEGGVPTPTGESNPA